MERGSVRKTAQLKAWERAHQRCLVVQPEDQLNGYHKLAAERDSRDYSDGAWPRELQSKWLLGGEPYRSVANLVAR